MINLLLLAALGFGTYKAVTWLGRRNPDRGPLLQIGLQEIDTPEGPFSVELGVGAPAQRIDPQHYALQVPLPSRVVVSAPSAWEPLEVRETRHARLVAGKPGQDRDLVFQLYPSQDRPPAIDLWATKPEQSGSRSQPVLIEFAHPRGRWIT